MIGGNETGDAFKRTALPKCFANIDRLLYALEQRNLDGIVVSTSINTFYLTAFNSVAHKADEPRPFTFILSRHQPDHPVMVIADYYLSFETRGYVYEN